MIDISNCEQYVIARLDEAEAEIARLDAGKAGAEERIADLEREAGKVRGTTEASIVAGMRRALFNNAPAICMADAAANAAIDRDLAGTLKANNNNNNNPPIVSSSCSVRRLTPRECERLQGFPDDWTLIPYRGKPAEECPDTPRYKALGNSMAVNVMRWLGVRIDAVDEGENPDEACSRLRGQISRRKHARAKVMPMLRVKQWTVRAPRG